MLEKEIAPYFADDLGYHAIQAIPGVGPVLAAVFVAEIGDIARFSSARHLCSWAGLTPTHHESDEKVRRGHITKQGSRLVRWAAVEAVARQRGATPIRRSPPSGGRAPGQPDRPGGGRPQTSHPRLLRPARRRDPLPGRDGVRPGTDATRCELVLVHGPRIAARPTRLIEPTGLRPNHSMSQFGRRDDRHPGSRVARQHVLALEMDRNASPIRQHRGRPRSPDGLRLP